MKSTEVITKPLKITLYILGYTSLVVFTAWLVQISDFMRYRLMFEPIDLVYTKIYSLSELLSLLILPVTTFVLSVIFLKRYSRITKNRSLKAQLLECNTVLGVLLMMLAAASGLCLIGLPWAIFPLILVILGIAILYSRNKLTPKKLSFIKLTRVIIILILVAVAIMASLFTFLGVGFGGRIWRNSWWIGILVDWSPYASFSNFDHSNVHEILSIIYRNCTKAFEKIQNQKSNCLHSVG